MNGPHGKGALPPPARKRTERIICAVVLIAGLLPATHGALAQAAPVTPRRQRLDIGVTFLGDRTNPVHGSNSWLTGGGFELGADAFRGFGLAVDIAGLQTSSIGSPGVPLAFVTTTFGPRYRYTRRTGSHREPMSLFGEALIGEVNAFHTVLPSAHGAIDSDNALALEMGGGIDLGIRGHLAFRALQAEWLRTQLPNGTTNVQNHLQLRSGLVLSF